MSEGAASDVGARSGPRFYFNLHGVGAPHAGVDESERPYWVTADRLAEILNLVSAHAPDVGVTFDDGNLSDLEIAAPALKAAGLAAHFFIPTDRIGAPHYLSAANIRALHDQGMAIGSHGLAHVNWAKLADAELEAEIARPLAVLSDIIGAPVRSVGVPFGAYDGRVLRALRKHGVTAAFTSDGGPCLPGAWLIPRNTVRADMPVAGLESALARPRHQGAYYVRATKRVGRRLLRSFGR